MVNLSWVQDQFFVDIILSHMLGGVRCDEEDGQNTTETVGLVTLRATGDTLGLLQPLESNYMIHSLDTRSF